jgi:divalent metal cation (Fe/Co/Zn/Cd) transporter
VLAVRVASLALAGVGASVLVDEVSSVVLVWRFRQHRTGTAGQVDAAEARALKVATFGLLIVGVALIGSGIQHLVASDTSRPDNYAIAAAAASFVVLPLLAKWKYAAAAALPSRALRTDAHISLVGAGTAALTLLGLALTSAFGWRWADPVAAIVIGVAAAVEGRKAIVGRSPA